MSSTKKAPARKKAPAKKEAALVVVQPSALQQQSVDVMRMIERVALNADLPIERMERLFAFQKDVREAQAKTDYDTAMARFQQLKESVPHNRTGEGPGGSTYTYSDFPQMTNAIAPWLKDTQLSYSHRQEPPVVESGKIVMIMVNTRISHVGGHTEEFPYPAIPDYKLEGKQALNQIVQRAITYAKRQGVAEGFGLATAEDKDDHDNAPIYAELVSDKKAADITAMLDETGADPARYFEWCTRAFKRPVAVAADIPDKCADDAIAQLVQYKKKRAR